MSGLHLKSLVMGIVTAGGVLVFLYILLHSVAAPKTLESSTPCPETEMPAVTARAALSKRHTQSTHHKRSTEFVNAEDDVPLRQGNLEDMTDKQMKYRQYFEHVKSFRANPLLQKKTWGDPSHPENWQIQTYSRPWVSKEREIPCSDEEATKLSLKGVMAARAAYDDPDVFPPDLKAAKALLEQAISSDPTCLSAKLNLYIIRVGESIGDVGTDHSDALQQGWHQIAHDMKQDQESFDSSKKKKVIAKFYWFSAIVDELLTNASSDQKISRAMNLDPALVEEHNHPSRKWMRTALGKKAKDSDYYLRKGLGMLLAYYEYTPFLGGMPPLEYADTQRFLREWRYQTKFGISHYTTLVMQRSYQTVFDHYLMGTGRKTIANQESSGDPINTWMNVRLTETADRLAGAKMTATYGFTASYNESMYLSPHTDQPQCEMTMTMLVSAYPSPAYCTIYYMRKPPRRIDDTWRGNFEKESLDYYLNAEGSTNTKRQIGMLSVIRGRSMTHFTPPIRKNVKCVTVLAHFVPEDKTQISKADSSIGINQDVK